MVLFARLREHHLEGVKALIFFFEALHSLFVRWSLEFLRDGCNEWKRICCCIALTIDRLIHLDLPKLFVFISLSVFANCGMKLLESYLLLLLYLSFSWLADKYLPALNFSPINHTMIIISLPIRNIWSNCAFSSCPIGELWQKAT